jgi:subtilase family serine protease
VKLKHQSPAFAVALSAFAAAILAACGGSSQSGGAPVAEASPTNVASGVTVMEADFDIVADAETPDVVPTFHALPVLLDEPDDEDALDNSASARVAPRLLRMPADLVGISTRRLAAQDVLGRRFAPRILRGTDPSASPMATQTTAVSYTPAQIRAAYGLPALPATGAVPTAAQAAQMGAGQTIYIVDAMDDPNAAAELAAFNAKFGLPACKTVAIPVGTKLPLAAAPTTNPGCTLSVVYTNAAGAQTSTAPAYDSGWATEIALDVQWAHATAPLARIILIEAADTSINSLLGAVRFANAMGPGIVSMSWGANEGSWTASVDSAFSAANMTYLAAAGDSGAGVMWPAVSPRVVAVGGTSLTYSGTGSRSESVWSGTGGGISAYTPTPSYQTTAVPGLGSVARRSVTDVSFNANPSTGQVTAVIPRGSSSTSWMVVGGTSLSTPQWGGVIAIANAMRATSAKTAIGAPHAFLYSQIATQPGTYASTLADITSGSNGTCATCPAHSGYDQPSGLGSPNVAAIANVLAGVVPAPVVTPATITGKTGTPLSFTVSVSASNPVTYSLSGARPGMTISSAGVVTWPTPTAGTDSVVVIATDTVTKATGSATYTITITAPVAPTVTAATISGTAGKALSFPITYTAPSGDPLQFTLAGAPAGMTVGTTGTVAWASPIAGTYSVTATVADTKTGLRASAVYTVKIAAAPAPTPTGPVISFGTITGVAGKPLSGTISITDPGVSWLQITLSGLPLGINCSLSGTSLVLNWPSPVAGSYKIAVTVRDSAGRTASAVVPITVTAK